MSSINLPKLPTTKSLQDNSSHAGGKSIFSGYPTKIIEDLSDRNIKVVAERIDVDYMTLLRISKGKTKKPKQEIMEKLEAYLYGV